MKISSEAQVKKFLPVSLTFETEHELQVARAVFKFAYQRASPGSQLESTGLQVSEMLAQAMCDQAIDVQSVPVFNE